MISRLATMILLFGGFMPHSDGYVLRHAGLAEYQMGHYQKAEGLIRTALKLAEASNNKYDAALCYAALGDIRQAEMQFPEASRYYRRAISLLGQHREYSHALAILWRNLAGSLTAETQYGEALAALRKASKLVAQNTVNDPQLHAQILNSLGMIYYYQGKMAKAEGFLHKATELHFTTANRLDVDLFEIWNNIGRVYQNTRQYAKAEDAYRRSLQLAEARLGNSHPSLNVLLDNLGSLYSEVGRYREAELLFQRSLAHLEQAGPSFDDIFVMRTLYGLGDTYIREGDGIRAQGVLVRAAEIACRRVLPGEMPEALSVLNLYDKALKNSSNSAEAQRVQVEARRIRALMAFTVPLANAK